MMMEFKRWLLLFLEILQYFILPPFVSIIYIPLNLTIQTLPCNENPTREQEQEQEGN